MARTKRTAVKPAFRPPIFSWRVRATRTHPPSIYRFYLVERTALEGGKEYELIHEHGADGRDVAIVGRFTHPQYCARVSAVIDRDDCEVV